MSEKFFQKEVIPSQEAAKKSIFEHTFSTGAKLIVFEDVEGAASVKIAGKQEVTVNNFLPPGCKIMTSESLRHFIENHPTYSYVAILEKIVRDGWAFHPGLKIIEMGEWKSTFDLFALFHEIGHSFQGTEEKKDRIVLKILKSREEDQNFEGSEEHLELMKQLAVLNSKKERDAWAKALRAVRELQRITGLSLVKEAFGDRKALSAFIRHTLRSHRMGELFGYSSLRVRADSKIREHMVQKFREKADTEEVWNDFIEEDETVRFINSLFDKPNKKY